MPQPSDSTGPAPESREVTVVLLRHGESLWNAEGRYQGQLGPGLSDLGHDQAKRAADFLITTFGDFHRAIASDLPRVQETLRPWGEATGVIPMIDARWREVDSGNWSGRFPAEVLATDPDDVAAVARGEDIARGGGETVAQHRLRTNAAMVDAATAPFDGLDGTEPARVIVFTHGGSIALAATEALGLPPMGQRWLKPPLNCSVTVFRHLVAADGTLQSTDLVDYNVITV